MTPVWMLAAAVIAVLLAASAFVLSRVVALYRGAPLRWVWALATCGSVMIAMLWLRPDAPMTSVTTPRPAFSLTRRGGTGATGEDITGAPVLATRPGPAMHAGRALSTDLLRMRLPSAPDVVANALRQAWLAMSLGLLALIAYAALRLRHERFRWHVREVAGIHVFIAPTFGPALVGVVRPTIVLPEWVLSLDASGQRAIVTHEAEHRAAMDPLLIMLGLVAVVLMPWNPGLWLSWRGLRRSIELDCDERVVRRGIQGDAYARVLLNAWKTARGSWLPSTAFAERASGLGARVEHLMRPEPRGRAMRTLLGTAVAAGMTFVACATPAPQTVSGYRAGAGPYPLVVIDGVRRPELPPRMLFTGPVRVETTTTPTYRISYHGPQQLDTVAQKLYPSMEDRTMMQVIDPPASVAHFGDAAKYGVVLYYTPKYRDAGGAIIAPGEGNTMVRAADPGTPASVMTGRIYHNLFNSIKLPADREAQAMEIIQATQTKQGTMRGPGIAVFPLIIAASAERDVQLRALLTSDSDRARFDQRANEGHPRIMPTIEDAVRNEYSNIFGYPDERQPLAHRVELAPERQEQAHAIIRTHVNDELALYARAPGAWTSNHEQRLTLRVKRDADLRALLSSEEEREKFDRIAARLREMSIKRN